MDEYRLEDVARAMGFGDHTVSSMYQGGELPPPSRMDAGSPVWEAETIEPWMSLQIDLRDCRPRAERSSSAAGGILHRGPERGDLSPLASRLARGANLAANEGRSASDWRAEQEALHHSDPAWLGCLDQVVRELKDAELWPWRD